MQEPWDGEGGGGPGRFYERRRGERRSGTDRRGVLRWDPRAAERERRSGRDRRRASSDQTRQ